LAEQYQRGVMPVAPRGAMAKLAQQPACRYSRSRADLAAQLTGNGVRRTLTERREREELEATSLAASVACVAAAPRARAKL